MAITIKTVHTVTDKGTIGYTMTGIEVLERKDLPEMYLDSNESPVIWYDYRNSEPSITIENTHGFYSYLTVNHFYPVAEFQKRWKLCQEAGIHLRDVNHTLAEMRKAWHGTETFKS